MGIKKRTSSKGRENPSWLLKSLRVFIYMALGTAMVGLGYSALLVPNRIAAGGVTGLATLTYYLWGWPVGITVAIMNIPLLIWGFLRVDWLFIVKTLLATAMLSFWLELFNIQTVTQDLLLASIAGGALVGIGLGIVFTVDVTTGGSDLVARILSETNANIPMQWLMFIIDASVIATSIFIFSMEEALYAIVSIYVASRVTGWVLEGANAAKAFFIITESVDQVSGRIMAELKRGVTALNGTGMYSGKDKKVLLCVVDRQQTARLKNIIKEEDPSAFLLVADMREVLGEGFIPHIRKRGWKPKILRR